jgi:uncharacterized protein
MSRLSLMFLKQPFSVCRLKADAEIPAWTAASSFLSVTRTADELSIVCEASSVPDGVVAECGWRCLRVAGTLDFFQVGILASLVTPLAEAEIPLLAISTFDTDYLLVKIDDFDRALTALHSGGHAIHDE